MSIYEKILFLLQLVFVPIVVVFVSAVFTRSAIRYLCRWGFVAEMGERHIHKKVIPTAGGVGMIAAFVLGCTFFELWSTLWGLRVDDVELKFFLPIVLLFFIGIYDDRFGMRPVVKLIGQIVASILAWLCGIRLTALFGWVMPEYMSCVITVFWFLLFINAFNLIDGLDGLAAGLAVLSGCTMGIVLMIGHHWLEAVKAMILAGCCLGFLRYNFHPARVFMGDTGSMFLGYVLAALGLQTSNYNTSVFAIVIPVMACGVPLIDTALAVWRRSTFKIISKRSWQEIMSADRAHLHHRILDAKHGNQSRTAIAIYILSLILSIVGIVSGMIVDSLPMLAVLLLVITMVLVLRKFAVVEIWNSTAIVFKGLSMPRRGILVNILHPIYDLIVIGGAFGISIIFFEDSGSEHDFIYRTVLSALIIMIVLASCKVYKVFWLRAGTPDYLNLAYSVSMGFLLVLVVNLLLNYYGSSKWSLIVMLPAYLITVVGILGERIHLRCLQLMLPRYFRDSEFNRSDIVPTLLYGAGAQLPAYDQFIAMLKMSEIRIIGIVDNDLALQGQYVYGYKILGDISLLNDVYKRYKFRKIVVITPNPLRENYNILKKFAAEHAVELTFFAMQEHSEPLTIRDGQAN